MEKNNITQTGSGKDFLTHLAGLRGIAIILVVLFHLDSQAWSRGYLGVDVFLVMTGYLIFRGRLVHEGYDSLKDAGVYFLKRIRRIVPPMTALILLTVIVGMFFMWWKDELFLSKLGSSALRAKANMFLKSEFEDYFASDSAFIPLLHLWYLSVTLQVYLMYVVINQLVQRLPKWAIIAVLSLLGVVSLVYCYSLPIHHALKELGLPVWEQNKDVSYYQTLPRVWEVLAGGVACVLPSLKKRRVWATLLSLIAIAGILVPALWPTVAAAMPATLVVVACTVLVIKYLPESMVQCLLSNKPLVWLGGISFSLYLVHMPIIVYWRLWLYGHVTAWDGVWMVVAAILAGWGYWWCIEKRKFAWLQVILLWLMTYGLCMAGRKTEGFKRFFREVTLNMPTYKKWRMCTNPAMSEGLSKEIDPYRTAFWCMHVKKPSLDTMNPPLMDLGVGNKEPSVVLLGDSHAGHAYAGLNEMLKQAKLSGVYLATVVLPFHRYKYSTKNPEYKFYPEKEEALMNWLAAHPELKHVIIAQWWHFRLKDHPKSGATKDFTNDLRLFLQRIREMGKSVIIIGPGPEFAQNSMQHYYKILNTKAKHAATVAQVCTREQYLALNGKVIKQLKQLESEGMCTLIEPLQVLGEQESFPSVRGNTLLLHDTNHMTSDYSIWLYGRLKPQILRALNMGVVVEEAQVK